MHDVENEVRQLLRERSGDMGLFDPHIPAAVVRRSRARRALTAGAAGLGAAALVVVLVVGIRAFSVPDRRTPGNDSPSPTPVAGTWPGIWEYTTREQAETAQAQVDAGHMPWQTDAKAFLEAFATRSDGLGWDQVFFDESLHVSDPGASGPLTVHIVDCSALQEQACPHEADVTIERLLRRNRTGIWSVIAVEGAAFGDGVPPSFVGFANDAVVLVDSQRGKILSTIAGPDVVGRRVGGADFFTPSLALSPDRTTVYFSAMEAGGAGRQLLVASLDGGAPEDLGPGWDPLPSLDGGRLAYVACTPDRCGGALVILDLGTGEETRVPMGSSGMLLRPAAWLPDGRLAVNLYPGGSPGSIRLIDSDRPSASLMQAPSVDPPQGTSWWAVGSDAPTGGLLVAEACCGPSAVRTRVVAVDPDTGQALATVEKGSWWSVEPALSGRHLLLVDDEGGVYVARDGESPRKVADGFVDVDW